MSRGLWPIANSLEKECAQSVFTFSVSSPWVLLLAFLVKQEGQVNIESGVSRHNV